MSVLLDRSLSNDIDGADALVAWIERAVKTADNRDLLRRRLDMIGTERELLQFVHRFLLFNDTLAARVPYLAGLIHRAEGLFAEPNGHDAFSSLRNGIVAAYVAEAAADEYRMKPNRNLVHQHLSQRFFAGIVNWFGVDAASFDLGHPVPHEVQTLLKEAYSKHLVQPDNDDILAAIGFHLGLEFFADEEFNLVDKWLRRRYPDMVARLEQDDAERPSYLWLATHTVVEIHHYHAGLEAARTAFQYCTLPDSATRVPKAIRSGFNDFVDLQQRFYESILAHDV